MISTRRTITSILAEVDGFNSQDGVGGRVTVFQTKIPDVGVGALKSREDPNKRASEVSSN